MTLCDDGCPYCHHYRIEPCPCACHFATLVELEREYVDNATDIAVVRVALADALETRDRAMAAASQHETVLRTLRASKT